MKRILHILSSTISALFYPLWIPTYGMILFCSAISQTISLPWNYWLITIGSTFFMTSAMPLALIMYQVHRGDIEDIYITRREDRTLAYIETFCCFLSWWVLLTYTLNAPKWLCAVSLGGAIAIALVAIINHWWKISAHLTGIGGLMGGIISYYLFSNFSLLTPEAASNATSTVTYTFFYIVLGIALLVMYARLYLNAHTPWQVIAGLALGLSCTTILPLFYV